MGRVIENIIIKDKECWTLFDTGAKNTYLSEDVSKLLTTYIE